ncbi:hypothetical protein [Phenylobacterium sp.]|uniref:hypothetical protein n=1 Tax=Phenylobacterium sp. TaxID=1871053 RepID=UPI002DF6FC82|nr:hypothetical protein [Phenylobacterium sp.]
MTAVSWPSRLRASPELFPIDLHPPTDQVALLQLSRIDYEKASFLDTRLEQRPVLTPTFAELAEAARGLPVACDYIFHVGHVGSTLVSRLLGTHPKVFSLREPMALRTLAQAKAAREPWVAVERARRLAVFAALYSRTWLPDQRSLVKATSLVSGIAGELMALEPGSRALSMTVGPETYLATILGGPNSRVELRATAPARLARLNGRLGGPPWRIEDLAEGEQAAMSWACEMMALGAADDATDGRMAWIDFDRFLADPIAGLTIALQALHGRADRAEVERLAASAYFQRYSKAPEYGYGPQVRREVLAAARHESGAEIARGLAWLDRAACHGPVAAALQRAETIGVA